MSQERDRNGLPGEETSPLDPADAPTPLGPVGETQPGLRLTHGRVLADRYWPVRFLGRGGMGEVWQAFDLKLQVDVALKALHSHTDEEARERMRREVRVAREVVSSHVCRVFDLVEVDGHELLSMEYVDGQTLQDLLSRKGPLPLTEARSLAGQFLSGLEAVHAAGLVHRDFKPENVMITPAGRVVVMDFGIAREAESAGDRVAGTAPYMAPEQARGEPLDARADVFAAGVVLAEMVTAPGAAERSSRERVWRALHQDPPSVPEGPWASVIRRAVSPDPAGRPASARALNRELEEITLRVDGAEGKRPYPGLASFTAADAEHFFGREPEVEALLRRLRRASLVALVGPSGAGKTSFLQAGVVPALPEGWGSLTCVPGSAPLEALGRALGADAVEEALVSAARAWREARAGALLILDQFEELFTLNPPVVQARLAHLVGRLVSEADLIVVVSIRDDFFFQCQAHEALRPLFSQLVPLGPPTGAALHRALVQPALSLGYRFEDESLVTQMLDEVSRERGALPLLAFAAAGLWERRDRRDGLLTRRAYEAIGGVGGALARHAEATLEDIGLDREPVVRELFRNLVTAEGTRVARDREELLSVFEDLGTADEVLRRLTEARLLTEFEVSRPNGVAPWQRIEVIHESLLFAWPRLEHWRTQYAEGAQLREQLREAARLWDERDRSPDLLWTGRAFREFELWRERYGGRLTSREDDFAAAMVARERRRRRRWRLAVGALVAASLTVAAVVGFSRQQESEARARAEAEALRAEASRLVALGRLELAVDPTMALAFARKSLEMHDTAEARHLAVEALGRGPTARVLPLPDDVPCATLAAAPDGGWVGCEDGEAFTAWSRSGRRLRVGDGEGPPVGPAGGVAAREARASWEGRTLFLRGPDGSGGAGGKRRVGAHPVAIRRAAWYAGASALVSVGEDREIRVWSGPDLELAHVRDGLDARIFTVPVLDRTGTRLVWHSLRERALALWDLAGPPDAAPLLMQRRDVAGNIGEAVFVGDGAWLAGVAGREVSLWALTLPWPRILRGHAAALLEVAFTADSQRLVSCGGDGARVWPLGPGTARRESVALGRPYTCNGVAVAPGDDQLLVAAPAAAGFLAPLGEGQARPLLPLESSESIRAAALDPAGRWAAVAGRRLLVAERETGAVRSYAIPRKAGEPEGSGGIYALRFVGEGGLLSAGSGGVLRWNLHTGQAETLLSEGCGTMDASADGRRVAVGCLSRESRSEGRDARPASRVFVLDLATGGQTRLTGHGDAVQAVALDPSGEVIATGDTTGVVRVGRLDGGAPHLLLGARGVVPSVDFSPDGRWVAGAVGSEVWLWPTPDLSRAPLHTRPLPELMATLDGLTNVELVSDASTPVGYRADLRPFPGWETAPAW